MLISDKLSVELVKESLLLWLIVTFQSFGPEFELRTGSILDETSRLFGFVRTETEGRKLVRTGF